jgi:N-acetylglutamate synthase-like GNAT family acetyltransferase
MKIDFLKNHPGKIRTVAWWTTSEWGDGTKESLSRKVKKYRKYLNSDKLPLTIIALDANRCVGAASLVKNDIKIKRDYSPWLASVIVSKRARGQGIGTMLVNKAVELAAELGIKTLYLHTENARKFYEKTDWEYIETITRKNGITSYIYKKDI